MINHTIIIAEAGINHNGDIEVAKKMVDVAADSGADFVKFQTFIAKELVTPGAKKAFYQAQKTGSDESQYQMLHRLELTESMHHNLILHCQEKEIGFLSTAFDIKSLNLLIKLKQELFKIPSGEITNFPYLKKIAELKKKIILSTGMSVLSDIDAAINVIEKYGTLRENITVLHCTSEYPAPFNEINLQAIQTIRDTFNVAVGYSDHTLGIEASIAAVAMGASVIEKHFTLDKNFAGPDHQASILPGELSAMIKSIRNIELALGDGAKLPSAGEIKNMEFVRKSLVASRRINKGELFNSENLTSKRPGTGISPMRWNDVLGKTAKKDFLEDELIEL